MGNRRLLRLIRGPFDALRSLPLLAKLLLAMSFPIMVVLAVTMPLTVNGLTQLERDTSTARLREEVKILSQQFGHIEADLVTDVTRLTSNPLLRDTIQRSD